MVVHLSDVGQWVIITYSTYSLLYNLTSSRTIDKYLTLLSAEIVVFQLTFFKGHCINMFNKVNWKISFSLMRKTKCGLVVAFFVWNDLYLVILRSWIAYYTILILLSNLHVFIRSLVFWTITTHFFYFIKQLWNGKRFIWTFSFQMRLTVQNYLPQQNLFMHLQKHILVYIQTAFRKQKTFMGKTISHFKTLRYKRLPMRVHDRTFFNFSLKPVTYVFKYWLLKTASKMTFTT